jgi:hypothetical protein
MEDGLSLTEGEPYSDSSLDDQVEVDMLTE